MYQSNPSDRLTIWWQLGLLVTLVWTACLGLVSHLWYGNPTLFSVGLQSEWVSPVNGSLPLYSNSILLYGSSICRSGYTISTCSNCAFDHSCYKVDSDLQLWFRFGWTMVCTTLVYFGMVYLKVRVMRRHQLPVDKTLAAWAGAWVVTATLACICCVGALASARAATHSLHPQPVSALRVDPANHYVLLSSTETMETHGAMKELVAVAVLTVLAWLVQIGMAVWAVMGYRAKMAAERRQQSGERRNGVEGDDQSAVAGLVSQADARSDETMLSAPLRPHNSYHL